MTAPLVPDEAPRLATLRSLKILDTPSETAYDDLVLAAAALLDVPTAYLSLVDADRLWIKAKRGLDLCETPREGTFCAHTVLGTEPIVVPNAAVDSRFADNPFVTGPFGLRFYAGVPVIADGQSVGTLCCVDTVPHSPSARQIEGLCALARQAEALLRARTQAQKFAQSERRFATFFDHAPLSAFMKDAQGRYRFSNRVFERGVGRDTATILDAVDHELFPAEAADGFLEADAEVRRTFRPLEIEEDVPVEGGPPERWRTLKFPLEIEGETWVGGIGIDLTALREAEARVREQNAELIRRERELTVALQEAETAQMSAQLAAGRFAQLFDGLPIACFTYGAGGTIHEWNAAAEALWGIQAEDALLGSIEDVVVGPANRSRQNAIDARVFAGETVPGEERLETMRDGREHWLHTSTFPLKRPSGEIVGAVCASLDVTERKRMEAELRESEARFRTVVESLAEGLVVHDESMRIVYWNRSAERILGMTADQIQGLTQMPKEYRIVNEDGSVSTHEDRPANHALRSGKVQEPRVLGVQRPDGEFRWISVGAVPVIPDGGRPTAAVASFLDITERFEQDRRIREYSAGLEAANARLEALATTDGLTGLKNHRFFQDWLRRRIEQCGNSRMPLSIALLDVDRFKAYNDDFGHQAGDAVLKGVAAILERTVRTGDLVARYGGEEFVLVLPGADAEEAVAVAERVRMALTDLPFPDRAVTASFGVSTFGLELIDAPSMIRAADEALYRSKASGRNRVTHHQRLIPELNVA